MVYEVKDPISQKTVGREELNIPGGKKSEGTGETFIAGC